MAWDIENENGTCSGLDRPHQVALRVAGFEDGTLADIMASSTSKGELLNKLQVRLLVHNDKIEINGLFPY